MHVFDGALCFYVCSSQGGGALPGSPFSCVVSTLTPSANQCTVAGKALTLAIAREPQSFEVHFRDVAGQVAHAEELDLYVEPNNDPPATARETQQQALLLLRGHPRRL